MVPRSNNQLVLTSHCWRSDFQGQQQHQDLLALKLYLCPHLLVAKQLLERRKLGNKHASTTDQWISSPSLTFHTIQPLWRVLQTCIHSERCACVLQYKQPHEYPPPSSVGASWSTHIHRMLALFPGRIACMLYCVPNIMLLVATSILTLSLNNVTYTASYLVLI